MARASNLNLREPPGQFGQITEGHKATKKETRKGTAKMLKKNKGDKI